MSSHPNAIAWWKSLGPNEREYWTNRFNTDVKEGEDRLSDKEDYCYQTMLWERCENGSC